ncbi:MAG: response regulator [Planctomycetota bacterium]
MWEDSCRILLIDDVEVIREIGRDLLEEQGHRVTLAANGEEGIHAFRQASPPYDVVLLDMVMPGLDSREVFRQLKGIAPSVPVVLMSGYTDQVDGVAHLMDMGAKGFLSKPFTAARLTEAIEPLLEKSILP